MPELVSGKPITDNSHLEINERGMQKDYVVMTEEEKARGFVRPVRNSYVHEKCGNTTTMGNLIAETYATDPSFYTGTYCYHCKGHFPVGEHGEFYWTDNPEQKVGL